MKPNEKILAEASRIEIEEKTGRVFLVFEIVDEKLRQDVKKNWTADIEYRLVDRSLVEGEK